MMVSPELVEQLQQLSPAEKLRVVKLLVNDLAVSDTDQISTSHSYDVWSPFAAADAALKLQQILDK